MTRLRELVPAVMHHHENWDGTGYPKGLKGTEIPLASRVIMFADTFDAMTTKRPYRGPLDEAAVRAELVRCRGKQFDPEIADRLLTSDFWQTLFPPRTKDAHPGLSRSLTRRRTRRSKSGVVGDASAATFPAQNPGVNYVRLRLSLFG